MSIAQRINILSELGFISSAEKELLIKESQILSPNNADKMSENVIGVFGLPMSIATNFLINDKEYIVPMVVEEPSIVAGVSGAAKIIKRSGGFEAKMTESLLIGQIQVLSLNDINEAVSILEKNKKNLLKKANQILPNLIKRGGGVKEVEIHTITLKKESTIVLHLLVDTKDAMGANLVNTMCENLAHYLENLIGGKVGLRILSNLSDRSMVEIKTEIPVKNLEMSGFSGETVRDGVVNATEFANADPYRAATHNKGIMNGIDAVSVATGNDWRAIEAAAHAYASSGGVYKSLSQWKVSSEGNLKGILRMPIKVGIVGGTLTANPASKLGLNLSKVNSSSELAKVMGSVGLAQNLAALRALVTHGIQQGHMKLHARSAAISADIPDKYFSEVVKGMIDSGEIKAWKAKELLIEAKEIPEKSKISSSNKTTEELGKGYASGKVILLGEHAVVYKHPAIACPIIRAVNVHVERVTDGIEFVLSGFLNKEIDHQSDGYQSLLSMFSMICELLEIDNFTARIKINSRIPYAMGMGASAAFAVAITRGVIDLFNLSKTPEEVNKIAFECEKITHGMPSGVDNTVAVFGRPIFFKKGKESFKSVLEQVEPLPIVIGLSHNSSNTAEVVSAVNSRYKKNKTLYEDLFKQIGRITNEGFKALKDKNYDKLGELMNISQGLLNAIGVSNSELEKMVDLARSSGAIGAKLTGSGGGGSIIALCPGKETEVKGSLEDSGYKTVPLFHL